MTPSSVRRVDAGRAVALLVLALLALAPRGVSAQSAEDAARARALFDEGVALSDRGEYELAIERFRRSIALVERPSTLFNLGVALRELRRDEEAIDALERFLALADASIDPGPRAQARSWIDSMRRAIEQRGATLVLEHEPREATVLVDGMDAGAGSPLVVDVAPGAHRVEVAAPGRVTQSFEVSLAPGERLARRVALDEQRAPDPGEPLRIAGWTLVGASAAALGAAIAATVAREDQVSRYNGPACDPTVWAPRVETCPSLRAEIDVTTGLAAMAWIGGALLGGAGALLVVLAPASSEAGAAPESVRVACGPGTLGLGVACAGRF